MTTPMHNKIINKVARKIFKEHGIERKGQSRTWLDDQYWYTTIIEFQPFKDQQGACLNVGVNFHWYLKKYFSFDIGYRESDFIEFKSEEQFEAEIIPLIELALAKALDLRIKLNNINLAEKTILVHNFTSDELWGNYHRAIITGLNNNKEKAAGYFKGILKHNSDIPWIIELKNRTKDLIEALNTDNGFNSLINSIIEKTRIEKKLKNKEIKNVW